MMLNNCFKCLKTKGFDGQSHGQEAGRLKLVNALAHRGRAWARLTFGQAQMLACADLLACAFIAISVAVYGSGSVWTWQCASVKISGNV